MSLIQDEELNEDKVIIKLHDDMGITKEGFHEVEKELKKFLASKKAADLAYAAIMNLLPTAIAYGVWMPEKEGEIDFFDKFKKTVERE